MDGTKETEREERENAYRKLITEVRESYLSEPGGLFWSKDCDEINLWTYWQGRGNLYPKILVVGQDWGAPEEAGTRQVMDNIRRMKAGEDVLYMDEHTNPTDGNLIRLFETIGYKIHKRDQKNCDLFFTNLVLGYRRGNISGGLKPEWIRHDAKYFKSLAEILMPKVILCLGKETFKGVLKALGEPYPKGLDRFNRFLDSGENFVKVTRGNEETYVFSMAHPGSLGVLNRNRGKEKMPDSLYYQKKDWENVKEKLNNIR